MVMQYHGNDKGAKIIHCDDVKPNNWQWGRYKPATSVCIIIRSWDIYIKSAYG